MTHDELLPEFLQPIAVQQQHRLEELRDGYANARHEPLRIYLGDFRWTTFTVARALEYGEREADRLLR